MTNKQESRFSMYLAVIVYCGKQVDLTASLPNFSDNLSTLQSTSELIHQVSEKQGADITGATDEKKDLQENLIAQVADTARKLAAFAKLSKKPKLLKEISFSETELRRLPDTILSDTSQLIYDRAQSHLGELASYLITEATQTALQQSITAYKAALATPRIEKVGKTQATKQLSQLFKTGEAALQNMDAVVEIIRLSEPDFYTGYKSARKAIDTGTGKLALKGKVSDSQTGAPMKGVTISFWADGNPNKTAATEGQPVAVKTTATKGGFNIKTMASGTYVATLKKAGYAEQSLTVYVNNGELTVMDVKLAPL